MSAHNKTQLTHARINCALNYSSCDLLLPKISSSLYLLQLQVKTQQRYSNALIQGMIPYVHTIVQKFNVSKSNAKLTLPLKNKHNA